jgi:hypothetical protein
MNSDQAMASWIDSWHMAHQMMVCRGSLRPDGTLAVQGAYAAPSGPDWGWRIVLDAREPDILRMTMINISPDTQGTPFARGEERLAVEAAFTRHVS